MYVLFGKGWPRACVWSDYYYSRSATLQCKIMLLSLVKVTKPTKQVQVTAYNSDSIYGTFLELLGPILLLFLLVLPASRHTTDSTPTGCRNALVGRSLVRWKSMLQDYVVISFVQWTEKPSNTTQSGYKSLLAWANTMPYWHFVWIIDFAILAQRIFLLKVVKRTSIIKPIQNF